MGSGVLELGVVYVLREGGKIHIVGSFRGDTTVAGSGKTNGDMSTIGSQQLITTNTAG
jgi:hypothetical protein